MHRLGYENHCFELAVECERECSLIRPLGFLKECQVICQALRWQRIDAQREQDLISGRQRVVAQSG